MSQRILYYCPASSGGIFDYALLQAKALSEMGADVTLLLPQSCKLSVVEDSNVVFLYELKDSAKIKNGPRPLRRLMLLFLIVLNTWILRNIIIKDKYLYVLMASYVEYGAPFWTSVLHQLSNSGVRFGATLHDPYRDYVVGPKWFHNWSVRSGYCFLTDGFVHESIDRGLAKIPKHVRVSVLPHGPYAFPESIESGLQIRIRFGIPAGVKLLLSFGQIRDGKNLDLVIRALSKFDNVWLLVAGKEVGGLQKRLSDYQKLSEDCQIAERCRWFSDFVEPDHVGAFFNASDLILLTYSSRFHSASGVLNAAVQFRRPCLASSGAGPLRTQVELHKLGLWVEPDSEDAICAGLEKWLKGLDAPEWSAYLAANSWKRNAEVVSQAMFGTHD